MEKVKKTDIYNVRINSDLLKTFRTFSKSLNQSQGDTVAAAMRALLTSSSQRIAALIFSNLCSPEDFDIEARIEDFRRMDSQLDVPLPRLTHQTDPAPLPPELEPLIEQITNAVLEKLDGELPEKPAISPQAAAIRDLILKKKGKLKK
jgi:hypothetical protein